MNNKAEISGAYDVDFERRVLMFCLKIEIDMHYLDSLDFTDNMAAHVQMIREVAIGFLEYRFNADAFARWKKSKDLHLAGESKGAPSFVLAHVKEQDKV